MAAFATAEASPVATAVVAVAARPPSAARTMVDTIFFEYVRKEGEIIQRFRTGVQPIATGSLALLFSP